MKGESVLIDVTVRPGAKRNALLEEFDGRLKIALQAPPVDGKANSALLDFLASQLKCAKSQLELVAGTTQRNKRIKIIGKSLEEVQTALEVIRETP